MSEKVRFPEKKAGIVLSYDLKDSSSSRARFRISAPFSPGMGMVSFRSGVSCTPRTFRR